MHEGVVSVMIVIYALFVWLFIISVKLARIFCACIKNVDHCDYTNEIVAKRGYFVGFQTDKVI